MKPVKTLTISQITQRIDEIEKIIDKLIEHSEAKDLLSKRYSDLKSELNSKMSDNTFNKGVVTPLPPGHIDVDNSSVVTPKAPSQVEREMEAWEKSLEE